MKMGHAPYANVVALLRYPGTFASCGWTRRCTRARPASRRTSCASGVRASSSTTCPSSTPSTSTCTARPTARRRRTRRSSVSFPLLLLPPPLPDPPLAGRGRRSTLIGCSVRRRRNGEHPGAQHHVALPHRKVVPGRLGEVVVQGPAVAAHQVQVPDGRHPPLGGLRGVPRGEPHPTINEPNQRYSLLPSKTQ